MPNDPNAPGGPQGPNNADPAILGSALNNMNQTLDANVQFASGMEAALSGAADQAERLNKAQDVAGKMMKDRVDASEKLNRFAKQLGKMDESRFKNAEHAH